MRILFWLNIGLDKQATSGHLMCDVVQRLAENGHKVHVLQLDQQGPLPKIPKQIQSPLVTTTCIPCRTSRKNNFILRYLNELRYDLDCIAEVKRSRDCGAVFIQSSNVAGAAVWLARRYLKKAKITLNVQDVFPYNAAYSGHLKKNSLPFRILAAIQRYGYRHADAVITISEDMKELLIEDGVAAEKIEVICNWSYQDEVYDRAELDLSKADHMFRKEHFNVVYAGNIGVMQNVDILIETARLMKGEKDVWFHIIGDGVYKEKLQQRAAQYGLSQISFWPMQPSALAPVIYSAADVNVIPLVKHVYRTAFPSKTATCLACGRPIIFAIGKASKLGQKLMAETGCPLVESDSAQELAEAIRSIRDGKAVCRTDGMFKRDFCRSQNRGRYARIIEKE